METKKKKVTFKQWEDAIRKARTFINSYDKVRFKIAAIAMEVCDTSHGGRKNDSIFSISKFAAEIEVDRKTLYEWIRVKRLVLDKLPKGIQDKPQDYKYDHFRETALKVDETTPPKEVKSWFFQMTERNPELVKFQKYGKWLKTLLYNAQRPMLMKDIPEDLLVDYAQKLNTIHGLINTELQLRTRFADQDQQNRKRLNMKLKELDNEI